MSKGSKYAVEIDENGDEDMNNEAAADQQLVS